MNLPTLYQTALGIRNKVNKKMTLAFLALLALISSASAWTPDYVTGDLGRALVNLLVTVVIVFTGKTPDLVDLAAVGIMIGIIGFIISSLVGIATLAVGVFLWQGHKKGSKHTF